MTQNRIHGRICVIGLPPKCIILFQYYYLHNFLWPVHMANSLLLVT